MKNGRCGKCRDIDGPPDLFSVVMVGRKKNLCGGMQSAHVSVPFSSHFFPPLNPEESFFQLVQSVVLTDCEHLCLTYPIANSYCG